MEIILFVLLTAALVGLSALCSGLNVALLSIDLKDIRRKAKLGEKHAMRALHIRENVHFYLSGILLANVAFASGASIVLGGRLSGLFAVIVSTLLLVVFAEITPQAIAVSRAVKAVSFFRRPVQIVTYIAYPATKLLAILLDKIVGSNNEVLHTRHELGLLIADHLTGDSELDEDEVEIVQNAIQLSEKRVRDIMTPMKKVFFMRENDAIDAKAIDKIKKAGYSRIPVFDKKASECKGYILVKRLIDIDFEEKDYKVSDLKTYKTKSVGSMTALDTMFRKFIAAKRHLMTVEKNDKIVGIVTIEDMLEEVIGHEIEDETDHLR